MPKEKKDYDEELSVLTQKLKKRGLEKRNQVKIFILSKKISNI